MAAMTAGQSTEQGQFVTTEQFRFVFTETDKKLAELAAQSKVTDKKFAELAEQHKVTEQILAETSKKIAELAEERKQTELILAETSKKIAELAEESKETKRVVKELSKNIGGISRSLGKWSEEMVAVRLCEKVNAFGYEFTRCGRNVEYRENGQRIAEIDCFLENGTVLMLVEVKVDLTKEEVDEYIEKVKMIRYLQDKRSDKRTIVAAVAGAIVPESVCNYAQKQGLYVLMQSGENIAIANSPKGFLPRKWQGRT
ncbi:MAG: hypothetical protein LBD20_04505 [Spirochaetaceae bacterium]|jgi:hypothetical protein|nr:hypothetical protein [Spirochaetaceae bacterium]